MKFSPELRELFTEIERRKASKEDPCDNCDGTGRARTTMDGSWVCNDCLGQGVLLTEREREFISYLSHADAAGDQILDSEYLN